jgi:hypothetical protein
MAACAEVRTLLAIAALPAELIDELLGGASAMWVTGEP